MLKSDFFNKLTFLILWLTLFTIPWQKSLVISGIGSFNKLLGMVLIFLSLFTVISKKKIKKPPVIFLFVFIYVLWVWLSWFWTQDPEGTISKNILLLQLVFLSWIIYEFTNTVEQLESLLIANVLGCLILSSQSIIHFLTGTFASYDSRFDLEGLNPNDVGYMLALAIPLAWYLGINRSKLFLLYIPVASWAILLTASRTAFIVTAFIFINILIYIFRAKIRYSKLILITITLLCFVAYKQVPQTSIDRIATIGSEITSGTFNERTVIWSGGLNAFKNHPIVGVGSGAYGAGTINYTGLSQAMNAHNVFISVLVEIGLVGFVLFTCIVLSPFVMAKRLKYYPWVQWLLIVFALSWCIISTAKHTDAQKYTWEMFGLIWVFYYLYKAKIVKIH